MTPTPPSTTASSSGHSPDGQYRVVRKRNRVPLSCAPCRLRKLKCNRTNPCENCVKRGDAVGCSYAMPGARKKAQNAAVSGTPDDMQNRIDRLEGLVLSLMTNGPQSAGPTAAYDALSRPASDLSSPLSSRPINAEDDNEMREEEEEDSELDSVSNSFGVLKVDAEKGKSMYIGDSHMHLILADIAEVKNFFMNSKREIESQIQKLSEANPATGYNGTARLFGANPPATDAELRAALPNHAAIEKLVSRYFNSYDDAVHIIHYRTFHKQLVKHFQDPTMTSIAWLALLFAILCLAMQSYHKIKDEPPEWKGRTQQLATDFRMRTVQSLINSDYTKGNPFGVEALLLYVHGEYTSRWDTEVSIWVIVGVIVRLAMRMGYHKDPSHFSGLSAYQGEMRRRVWAFLRTYDIMFSFQVALPIMTRKKDCDVALPRNIAEDELYEDMRELPESRPAKEPTPVSYLLATSNITFLFGEVMEVHALSETAAAYEEVMKMDTKLREVRTEIPPHLRIQPLDQCPQHPATLLMQRFTLDILYQKALCVLHRKYLVRARTHPKYAHSRRTAVESSMELLQHQATLHRESHKGGRMRTMRWFISSLINQDFLLGAAVLCLDLNYDNHASANDSFFWTVQQRMNMYQAIETSYSIFKESEGTSMEAFKAAKILKVMLDKLRCSKIAPSSGEKSEPTTKSEVFAAFDEQLPPEHSAAMTLGMLQSGGLTPNTAAMFSNQQPLTPNGTKFMGMDTTMLDPNLSSGMTPNYMMDSGLVAGASPFSQVFGNLNGMPGMMDAPSNLDWDAWDQYVQSGNSLDPAMQFYPQEYNNMATSSGEASNGPAQNAFGHNTNSIFMGANTPGRM